MHVEIDRYGWWCSACKFGVEFATAEAAAEAGEAHAARHEPMLPVDRIEQ